MPTKLTDLTVKTLPIKGARYAVYDSGCTGLYIEVLPTGLKVWRSRVFENGKRKIVTVGHYGDVTLSAARDYVNDVRKQARDKRFRGVQDTMSFATLAQQWLENQRGVWTPGHYDDVERRLNRYVLPFLSEKPVTAITTADVLTVARQVEAKGAFEIAHRTLQAIGAVLRFGIASGLLENDVTLSCRRALKPVKKRHLAAITNPDEIGPLMRAIHGYDGEFVVRAALKFMAYVFPRPGELRFMEWSEVNLTTAEWRQPPEKQKVEGRPDHVIPLSRQAVGILQELLPVTGSYKLVFAAPGESYRPISENTLGAALRRMGYAREVMTAHGFRSMASSLLNESGLFSPDVIEAELNHQPKNAIRAAYNRTTYLPQRREMMAWYADRLDELASRGEVVRLVANEK